MLLLAGVGLPGYVCAPWRQAVQSTVCVQRRERAGAEVAGVVPVNHTVHITGRLCSIEPAGVARGSGNCASTVVLVFYGLSNKQHGFWSTGT